MTKEETMKHLKLMQSGARNAIRFTKNNKEISEEERKEDIEIYQDQLTALNMAIKALSAEPQGDLISRKEALAFPFANGKYDHKHANEHFILGCESYKEWLEQLPSAEPQDSADRERVIALRVNNRTCVQCKHYKCFDKKEFPCIDCMLDCKDRFEPKPVEPQEWISVKDSRKPKTRERVWVTDCDGEVWIMYYNDWDCYFNEFGDVFTEVDIIAWQPIIEPSPYKGAEDD